MHPSGQYNRVLVVEDEPVSSELLRHYLSAAGCEAVTVSDAEQAMHYLQEHGARIVLSDWNMPGADGLDLCRRIRAHEELGFVYFIMVTSHANKELLVEAFNAGVDDFIAKPFFDGELMARVRVGIRVVNMQRDLKHAVVEAQRVNAELAVANERLNRIAVHDDLTGLHNRRAVLEFLAERWVAARRDKQSLSCLVIDIDHFKAINDTYGHMAGDEVLRQLAAKFSSDSRSYDLLGRFGGEEFLLVLPNHTEPQAYARAQRLRQDVETMRVTMGEDTFGVTVSVGVAEMDAKTTSMESLIHRADQALYAAKAGGRNKVCAASTIPTSDVAIFKTRAAG